MIDIDDDEIERSLVEQTETAIALSPARALRFYDRVRGRIQKFVGEKRSVLGRTADFLLLVPDVFILLWRLLGDSRVTGRNKLLLGSAVVYYIFPFDLLPEGILGPIGYLDDLVFGVYVLNRMLVDVDPALLREHWSGNEDILLTIQRVMNAADQLVSKEIVERLRKIVK